MEIAWIFGIAELFQQLQQLVKAAMNIANDVERALFMFQVVPERLTDDLCRVDFFNGGKSKYMAEAFALQATQRAAQVMGLIANYVRPKVAIRTALVAVLTNPFRHI
jgi:hypothetical protein